MCFITVIRTITIDIYNKKRDVIINLLNVFFFQHHLSQHFSCPNRFLWSQLYNSLSPIHFTTIVVFIRTVKWNELLSFTASYLLLLSKRGCHAFNRNNSYEWKIWSKWNAKQKELKRIRQMDRCQSQCVECVKGICVRASERVYVAGKCVTQSVYWIQ